MNSNYSLYGIVGCKGYRAVGIAPSGIDAKHEGITLGPARIRKYNDNNVLYDASRFLTPISIKGLFTLSSADDRIPQLEIRPGEIIDYRELPLEARVFDPVNSDVIDRTVFCLIIKK